MSKGGKLSRTETVTVRLDPRLNYLADLVARDQRRTKSSFIEWAVHEAVKGYPELADLWHPDASERLDILRECKPGLLTYEEQVAWANEPD